jgi:hypothetical protein
MGTWFWLNVPLALLFVCCWAGIPMWLLLTHWHAELEAQAARPGRARDRSPQILAYSSYRLPAAAPHIRHVLSGGCRAVLLKLDLNRLH